MIARSVALGLVILGLTACAARIASRSAERCVAGSWSEPQPIMVGKGVVHVESPQMVPTHRGLVFFGNNSLVLDPRDDGFHPIAGWPRGPGMLAGVIRRPDGRFEPVPLPRHLRAFIEVQAVGDRHGNVHVFWGESPDTTSQQSQHLRGVWYARFDGEHWTEPERVLEDSTLQWNYVFTAIVTANGVIHIAVPAMSRHAYELVLIRQAADGRRSVRRLPGEVFYPALGVDGQGALYLAYIVAGSRAPAGTFADREAIVVRRSDDGGDTWAPPAVIFRGGLAGANAVRLVATAHGIYAVWEGSPPVAPPTGVAISVVDGRHDSLQAAVSRDGGRTWTRIRGLSVPGGVLGLTARRGPDNRVHVAFQTTGETDTALVVATAMLDREQWSGPERIAPAPFWPTLASPFDDSLALAWDDWGTAGPERLPLTHWSTYHCGRSPITR